MPQMNNVDNRLPPTPAGVVDVKFVSVIFSDVEFPPVMLPWAIAWFGISAAKLGIIVPAAVTVASIASTYMPLFIVITSTEGII